MSDSKMSTPAGSVGPAKSKLASMRERMSQRKLALNASPALAKTSLSRPVIKPAADRISSELKPLSKVSHDESKVSHTPSTTPDVLLQAPSLKRPASNDPLTSSSGRVPQRKRKSTSATKLDVQSLLSTASHKETKSKEISTKISDLLNTPSVMEQSLRNKHSSQEGEAVQEFCDKLTVERCIKDKNNTSGAPCRKLHFRTIINRWTAPELGDCTFLNNCRRGNTCKFVHYEVDPKDRERVERLSRKRKASIATKDLIETQLDRTDMRTTPAQWIQCDVRKLHMPILGKFTVIMADPPWDIHMDLPYGTMTDNEMRKLPLKDLTDDGYMFLWVTGRAMELGRECLKIWGYEMKQELLWIKTNQLQKVIRSGRTGHWLNHSKEHCLVGVKGTPPKITRVLDCDVLVAEVRDTSHKPDEVYGMIERLSPGTRKLEVFGRQHNTQPNWVTLGNQLKGINLVEVDVVERFNETYPYDQMTTQKLLLTGKLDV